MTASTIAGVEACLRVNDVKMRCTRGHRIIPSHVASNPGHPRRFGTYLSIERRYSRNTLGSGSTPRVQRLTVRSNTADDTWTWTSQRSHLEGYHFMNVTWKGQACLGLTNDRLRNQARDRTCQPHEASELLRDAERKQEGCPVSGVAEIRITPRVWSKG